MEAFDVGLAKHSRIIPADLFQMESDNWRYRPPKVGHASSMERVLKPISYFIICVICF